MANDNELDVAKDPGTESKRHTGTDVEGKCDPNGKEFLFLSSKISNNHLIDRSSSVSWLWCACA